jgi:hypothetical protein
MLSTLRNNLRDRCGNFTNGERLNRLLMLMDPELDDRAHEPSYAKIICRELEAAGRSLRRAARSTT